MTKITYDEFLKLLEDPDTPIETLRKYVVPAPDSGGGFDPYVVHNPDLVENPELENAMSIGNGWSRRRRRKRFRRRQGTGSTDPVVVSEGDSWFQFPILIDDIVDHLDDDFLIWSLGAAGDTAKNMIFDAPEYLAGLQEHADSVQAFMLSAAGNDVIGEDENGNPVLLTLLHNFSSGKTPEQLINKAGLKRTLDRLQVSYEHLIETIRADGRFQNLPILIHGYDYALAYPTGAQDKRSPFWAKRDQWLGSAFKTKGISGAKRRFEIVRYLIDDLYDMLGRVAESDPHVHLIDIRGTLSKVTDWADEIHGTNKGNSRVANLFRAKLKEVIPTQTAPPPTKFELSDEPDLLSVELDELAIETHKTQDIECKMLGFTDADRFAWGFRAEAEFEAIIGADDSVPFWFLSEGAARGKSVCKIEAQGSDFKGRYGRWSGTGFLIAPNILLTNSHVLNSAAVAAQSRVIFDYANLPNGNAQVPTAFRLDPSRLFLTSDPYDLDYCFVWVNGDAHDQFGVIPFWRGSFIGKDDEYANIIHHPNGDPKRASLKENRLHTDLGARETLIHYTSDTEPGSSGSPVMTDNWHLFALHHASKDISDLRAETRARLGDLDTRVLNEGIKTSAIAIDVELRSRSGNDAIAAREVHRALRGIDSRTGFFGTLGRRVHGVTGHERVVDAVQGAPDDIDIASWNIEWFNREVDDKVGDVARVIADHNLDIWALQEVSPTSTRRLVERLNQEFSQSFDYAVSEPEASDNKQTTTVIWNTLTVSGERLEWPSEAHKILKLDSRDPDASEFEAVEGKLFNRYPGLFRFSTTSRNGSEFDFNLVPLHLKARAEGAKRRRMASNALARAIQIAIAKDPTEHDWIICGDMNAELATGQFKGLTNAGFTALSAADEEDGAFTYLKHPYRSLIDSIFVSPGLIPKIGSDDFIIVAAERIYANFVEDLSDHRPLLVRLSLGENPSPLPTNDRVTPGETSGDLFEAFVAAFRADPDGVLRQLADLVDS